MFLQDVAAWGANNLHHAPKHYLSQFHPDYASEDAIERAMAEAGVSTRGQLFQLKYSFWQNVDLPVTSMFMLEVEPDETGFQQFVRNPYFHKVDSAGNQLPYIDRLTYKAISDFNVAAVETIAGEIDYGIIQYRATQFPVLKQNEANAPIYVGDNINDKGAEMALFFNMTHPDPVLRSVFSDVRFRQAVSVAINRDEIVDTVFLGAAQARQASNTPGTPVYDREWEQAFAQYDPDLANELLDDMGLTARDGDGYRLGPDGSQLQFLFDWGTFRAGFEDAYTLIVEYLADVGLRAISNGLERSIYNSRRLDNSIEMSTHSMPLGIDNPTWMIPEFGIYPWAVEWGRWYDTSGQAGEPPSPEVQELFDLFDQVKSAASPDAMIETMLAAVEIHKENLFVIGVFGGDARPEVAHDRLRNFERTDTPTASFWFGHPSMSAHPPEQWWLDQTVPIP